MKRRGSILASSLALVAIALGPALAQAPQQAAVLTYVAEWGVPRAQWGEMAQLNQATQPALDRMVDDGTILGYGFYEYQVHQVDGMTHGQWFQASSLANILKALDTLGKNVPASPVLAASKHQDFLYQTNLYNWKSTTIHNGYLWVGHFGIKPDHVGDWSRLFGTFIRPVLEDQMGDGTVAGYELDTEFVHTPGGVNSLEYAYITPSADGIERVRAGINAAEAKNTAIAAAISPLEDAGHFDILAKVSVMRHK